MKRWTPAHAWIAVHAIAVAAALWITADTVAGARADFRAFARRYVDILRLRALVDVRAADDAAAAALRDAGARPPELGPWLAERLPGAKIEVRERERSTLTEGWSLVRTDVMLEDVAAGTVYDALSAAATNRPPWRAVECQASATGPGRARFTVLVENVVFTETNAR